MSEQIERRFFAQPIEVRKKDDKKMRIGGYAARFGSVYDVGWFTEEVMPGAFDGVDMSDVTALFNHDPNMPLGRSSAGTLRLTVDGEGLAYEIDLPDSPNGQNVGVAVERGDVSQSSWGFTVLDEQHEIRGGKDHYKIMKVKRMYDVSPVTYPANPETSVTTRSRPKPRPIETDTEEEIFKLTRTRFLEIAGMVSKSHI